MKNKILASLLNSTDYISGQTLSENLNVSRNAIWKHINTLRDDGYIIDAIRNKGYKISNKPDILTSDLLNPYLKTSYIGRYIEHFSKIDSTNLKAKELASLEKTPSGLCVISEEQSSGTGRFSRTWNSPIGGIWNSIILKPNLEPIHAYKLTLITAVSMVQILQSEFNIPCKIKWPNDIYLNDKKICGILTTMSADMDKINSIVIGLGLNVNIDSSFFETNGLLATSLSAEYNKKFNRQKILAYFYNKLEENIDNFTNSLDLSEISTFFKENSLGLKKKAYLVHLNTKEEVTCIDINSQGELIIEDSTGTIRPVFSGEITFKNNED